MKGTRSVHQQVKTLPVKDACGWHGLGWSHDDFHSIFRTYTYYITIHMTPSTLNALIPALANGNEAMSKANHIQHFHTGTEESLAQSALYHSSK